jgi:hypothetical protein
MSKMKLEIKYYKIKDLIPAEYNPRKISKEAMEQLKTSLGNFDCVEPAVININPERLNVIIGGHQRIKAAKALKYDVFPCVEVNLPLQSEKELNIRLNKNTGEFDFDLLNQFFVEDDLLDWGFSETDFADDIEEVDLPEISSDDKEPFQNMTFTLHDEQAAIITNAMNLYKRTESFKNLETFGNENSNGNLIYGIIKEWLQQKI